nr:phospholipase D-like domain-containing protein [Xylanivirga thermophila]
MDDIKAAADRGSRIRILTGKYLNITQPSALYIIKDTLGDNVDLRLYNVYDRSFHPKGYICDYGHDGCIFVGSSNISLSALTYGIEWNYKIHKNEKIENYNCFTQEFERLFNTQADILDDKALSQFSKEWKKPKLYDEILGDQKLHEVNENVIVYPRPIGAQIETLYNLKKARMEGLDKGLEVAATGERVIIVMDAICVIKSRDSGTLTKYKSCIA